MCRSGLTWLGLAAAVALVFSGCEHGKRGASGKARPLVCIVTPMTHPALDETIAGFRDGIAQAGYGGNAVDVVVKNAEGDMDKLPSLLKQVIASKPTLVFTVTTPASVSAAKQMAQGRIPLVYAAVTDPVGAGIVTSMERSTAPITGVSDRYDVVEQVKLFVKLMPKMRSAAILYNPEEQNSRLLSDQTEEALKKAGIATARYQVMGADEVLPKTRAALARSDAVIVNGDNLVTEHLDVVIKACIGGRKPLFVGDPDSVRRGGVATVGPSYRFLGMQAGKKAAKILGGTPAGTIPSEYPSKSDYIVNVKAARAMGVEIPAAFWDLRDVWESRGSSLSR